MIPCRVLLAVVVAFTPILLPPGCHGLGEETSLEKAGGANSSSHMDVETVNAIVSAINQSLLEFRSMSAQLSARLEHVEKTLTDIAPDTPARIFMATHNQGLRAFSWSTNDAIKIKHNTSPLYGIAYDPLSHALYWCSSNVIYRGSKDDDQEETVFDSVRSRAVISDGTIYGLAFDWITSNLYGVSGNGIVFACNTTAGPVIECIVLLSGQGDLRGIAVNPIEGKMYWAKNGYVDWANMDGSSSANLVSSLSYPRGIVIDHEGGRLYWTDQGNHKIQSCNLQGGDVRVLVTLTGTQTSPYGITVLNDKVYFSTVGYDLLQSITKAGADIRTLYDGPHSTYHLILATNNLPTNRTNHCESLNCSRMCVLTGSSAKCMY